MLIYVFGVFVGDFFWGRPLLLLAGSINLDIFGPISSVINKKYAFFIKCLFVDRLDDYLFSRYNYKSIYF